MNITAKSRYALKIMMDLADREGQGIQQRGSIAQRQGIPLDYMDQITARLRNSNLLESVRGRNGGFKLQRPATEISVWDILESAEEHIYPVRCLEHEGCAFESSCISADAWGEVVAAIHRELSRKTLAQIVESWRKRKGSADAPKHVIVCER